jgi:hypothetical protein
MSGISLLLLLLLLLLSNSVRLKLLSSSHIEADLFLGVVVVVTDVVV